MIFLTVGTQLPFDRLARAVDDWCAATGRGDQVFGQLGSMSAGSYTPTRFEWVRHLAPADYTARFQAATLVVAHAGMGSILTAMDLAKPLVIMPRRAALGEHRNEHQLATAAKFGESVGIRVAADEAALPAALDAMLAGGGALAQSAPFASDALIARLRAEALGAQGKR